MRIKAKSIEITFSESGNFTSPEEFRTFEEANIFLRELARTAPGPGGGYHKTDFTITFEDGETYKGRIDLTNFESPDIGAHVRKFVEFYSGGLGIDQLPSHVSPTAYRAIVLRDMDVRDGAIRLLGNYELGDPVPSGSDLTKAQ